MANRGGKWEAVTDFLFLGSKRKSLQTVTTAMKLEAAASWQERYDNPFKANTSLCQKIKNSQDYGLFIVMYGCKSWTIKKTEH